MIRDAKTADGLTVKGKAHLSRSLLQGARAVGGELASKYSEFWLQTLRTSYVNFRRLANLFLWQSSELGGLVSRKLSKTQATHHKCLRTGYIHSLCDVYLPATYPSPSTSSTSPPYSSTHSLFPAHSPPSTPHNPSHQHPSTSSQGLRNT